MTENGKPTAKSLAGAALKRAHEEALRTDGSLIVLRALIEEAAKRLEDVEELKKPRPKPKAPKAVA